jgi:hypothetical protein
MEERRGGGGRRSTTSKCTNRRIKDPLMQERWERDEDTTPFYFLYMSFVNGLAMQEKKRKCRQTSKERRRKRIPQIIRNWSGNII